MTVFLCFLRIYLPILGRSGDTSDSITPLEIFMKQVFLQIGFCMVSNHMLSIMVYSLNQVV